MVVWDYKQFLAARAIQRKWRKFRWWTKYNRENKAATMIQKHWRGYAARKNFFKFVEDKLQQQVLDHFDRAATKIQALYRGHRVRQMIHDMGSLTTMQVCAAEDLLNCVAFKLHHLLRTYAIPGVYSLKNSNCLSRVEKLMASLHFRYYNGKAVSQREATLAKIEEDRKQFMKEGHYSRFPFPGPNYWSRCSPKCEAALTLSKDIDKRMYKIIEMYDASQKEAHAALVQKRKAQRKKKKLISQIKKSLENHKRDFCGDVIASMRKWKFLADNHVTVDKNIFRNPENLQSFINDISGFVREFEDCTCYCRIPAFDQIYCT
ncbi:hypothetical protein KR026_002951 [Drosophila bipectinata]|nr:hypothetical protein KR026_002951 [Drosophila bipectinata]